MRGATILNEKQDSSKKEFNEGDYIVILGATRNNNTFIANNCYKVRQNYLYLKVEKDNNGNQNGTPSIQYDDYISWRYASAEEVNFYKKFDKPFNVKDLNNPTVVFNKFNIGDIVVSLRDSFHNRLNSEIFKILDKSTKGRLYYKKDNWSCSPNEWRLATPEEIDAYEKGITNLNDMKSVKTYTKLDLLLEAERRYPIGTKFIDHSEGKERVVLKTDAKEKVHFADVRIKKRTKKKEN